MSNAINSETARLNFSFLPSFAQYILTNQLREFIKIQIRISREVELPLIKFFEGMAEDDLIELSEISAKELLNHLGKNQASQFITTSLQQWVNDELPQVKRFNIADEDITQVSYIRKQAFLALLPGYTTNMEQAFNIISEIDRFVAASDKAATKTYISIMNESISENIHLIEKIADTSPGIIYLFDLVENKEIYTNGKTMSLLGYTHDDFQALGSNFMKELEHPDDLQNAIENKKKFFDAKDNEVRSFEHRLKDSKGEYLWIRNYEAVFKRNEKGKPTQVIGIALNIDREKKMADKLLHREEQLLEAQDLAGMGSFEWDIANDNAEVTPQLMRIFNLEKKENLGGFMQMVHPSDREYVQQCLDKAINENGVYDCEFRYNSNGDEKIVWTRGIVSPAGDKKQIMKGTVMDVTDRHHMIQRLQRSENLYKQAQALTHLGNWTYEIEKNKITWTDEIYRIFGLAPQSEIITIESLLEYLLPKDKDLFIKIVDETKEGNILPEYFARIVLKDGSIKILNIKAEVFYKEGRTPYKMIGTVQDITQQKLYEKKLRENQNFIQKITDATPSVIAAYNVHSGKYLFINQAFEKLLGHDPKKALQEGAAFFGSLVHPDDMPGIMEKNKQALERANTIELNNNEMIVEFKYRMRHRNGSYHWFHTFGTIFDRDDKRQVEHVLNVSIDITDQVEAENKVREQEHFIQHIVDASPTILYLYDLEKNAIIYINKEVQTLLGYTPEEVIAMEGAVNHLMFHEEDVIKLAGERKQNAGQNIRQYECRMKGRDGHWRYLLVREIAFKQNEDGLTTEVLCAALDISDRKQIEDALYEKTIELEQSNSSLEQFAYVASHDLKEPLRKISTFGDRLLFYEQEKISPTSLSFLEKIIDSSQRMQRMIDDLLSLSMISGEKKFQTQNLQLVLNDVLQALEYKIEESKAVVTTDKLPPATVIVSQFRQLFQNLISNSIKFSKKDIAPQININHKFIHAHEAEIVMPKPAVYLRITFTDNGIGFDNKYADKIFSIFHRLHGKSEYEGTGIGLSICKRIVENHGGTIKATGIINEGATFTILLPV